MRTSGDGCCAQETFLFLQQITAPKQPQRFANIFIDRIYVNQVLAVRCHGSFSSTTVVLFPPPTYHREEKRYKCLYLGPNTLSLSKSCQISLGVIAGLTGPGNMNVATSRIPNPVRQTEYQNPLKSPAVAA